MSLILRSLFEVPLYTPCVWLFDHLALLSQMTYMLLPQMLERQRGAVINVCSQITTLPPSPLVGAYSASMVRNQLRFFPCLLLFVYRRTLGDFQRVFNLRVEGEGSLSRCGFLATSSCLSLSPSHFLTPLASPSLPPLFSHRPSCLVSWPPQTHLRPSSLPPVVRMSVTLWTRSEWLQPRVATGPIPYRCGPIPYGWADYWPHSIQFHTGGPTTGSIPYRCGILEPIPGLLCILTAYVYIHTQSWLYSWVPQWLWVWLVFKLFKRQRFKRIAQAKEQGNIFLKTQHECTCSCLCTGTQQFARRRHSSVVVMTTHPTPNQRTTPSGRPALRRVSGDLGLTLRRSPSPQRKFSGSLTATPLRHLDPVPTFAREETHHVPIRGSSAASIPSPIPESPFSSTPRFFPQGASNIPTDSSTPLSAPAQGGGNFSTPKRSLSSSSAPGSNSIHQRHHLPIRCVCM